MIGKARLSVFATLVAAGVLATAAFAATSTSTISLRATAAGKVLVAANGRTTGESFSPAGVSIKSKP